MSAEIEVGQTWVLIVDQRCTIEILGFNVDLQGVWYKDGSNSFLIDSETLTNNYTLKPEEEFKKGDICFFWNDIYDELNYVDKYAQLYGGKHEASTGVRWKHCRKITPEDLV